MSLCERCENGKQFRSIEGYYICKAMRGVVVKERPMCYDFKRDEKKVER